MIKHKLAVKSRGSKESLVEIVFFPKTDKERQLIEGAKSATLSEEDHIYFNELLTSICLNHNYAPIAPMGYRGNSFLFKVAN